LLGLNDIEGQQRVRVNGVGIGNVLGREEQMKLMVVKDAKQMHIK